ncbi:MAG: preprotein translocase subunit SecA [Myxococcales bacterium]|nr:preprotein translocase subunit SecA [Myxococcales bacterium]
MKFIKNLFGTANERALKKLKPLKDAVNGFATQMEKLSDNELKGMSNIFKERLEQGASLEDIQIEAFAVAREAAWRVLGMKPYDVQVVGGFALHQGNIAEMKTGEGKTLVATMPTYLNALSGKGVHVVTVNDYLARRDAEWMGQLYRWLGQSTGVIINGINDQERKAAYASDITYGQNNEFGFDYLRDNMKFKLEDYVQKELNFAIIDEVDSILIDEARTPLIISGPAESANDLYLSIDQIIPKLKKDIDYNVDEKYHSATLTDEGVDKVERLLGIDYLYETSNLIVLHHVNNALKAHTLYKRDVNYLVQNGQVMIIDEHTGRLMDGRRWSDGLHQAVEAKERVDIKSENHTLATVSFQNYFRLYNKLSGMTGTAKTEEEEFQKIYSLDVLEIPTNRPIARHDYPDLIYRTEQGKFRSCVEQIKVCYSKGQPVLVGTTSVEKSEIIHRLLKQQKIEHEVLNAKHHLREASIVAQAGRLGRVTVATNMAGRGTDIILGGNAEYWGQALLIEQGVAERYTHNWEYVEDFVKAICINKEDEARNMRTQHEVLAGISEETIRRIAEKRDEFKAEQEKVLAAGGLFILGTERHESRRIDNQLRGRAGRQGDPGESRFFLSLEDDLMRIFAKDNIVQFMDRLGMDDSQPIESGMVSRSVETAQRRIEGQHFDNRKNLLEYDDVMNQQRQTIYKFRLDVLKANNEELEEICLDSIEDLVNNLVDTHCNQNLSADRWETDELIQNVSNQFAIKVDIADLARNRELYIRRIYFKVQEAFFKQRDEINQHQEGIFTDLARDQYLQLVDELWKRHLQTMDQLRSGIGLRGYGQRDPKREYQREGFNLFKTALLGIKSHVMQRLLSVRLQTAEEVQAEQEAYERYVEAQEHQRRDREERARRAQDLAKAHRSAKQETNSSVRKGPSPDQILVPSKREQKQKQLKKAKKQTRPKKKPKRNKK